MYIIMRADTTDYRVRIYSTQKKPDRRRRRRRRRRVYHRIMYTGCPRRPPEKPDILQRTRPIRAHAVFSMPMHENTFLVAFLMDVDFFCAVVRLWVAYLCFLFRTTWDRRFVVLGYFSLDLKTECSGYENTIKSRLDRPPDHLNIASTIILRGRLKNNMVFTCF